VVDYLHIRANAAITAFAVYDLKGRLVFQESLAAVKEHQIALSNLPMGYFILEVVCEGQAIRKKLCAISE